MNDVKTTRRGVLGGLGLAGIAGSLGVAGARPSWAANMPSSPVALNIVDVAGNLALTQPAFDNYRREKSQYVSRMSFSQAPAPELPGKLKAMEAAGRLDIDLVITGTDALAAGIEQNLYDQLLPDDASSLPDLQKIYLPAAWNMQSLAKGQGVVVTYYPSGPLIEFNPAKVSQAPTTTDELLAWTKSNPKRFIYARPANSGPGRTFLMGLPYLLGDKDPMDPKNGWDKTWAYLIELGKNIEYYPAGTGAVMKELGEGSRDMTVTTTGWDINPRAIGVVPKEYQVGALQGFKWVGDAHYLCIPKGLSAPRKAVVLDLISFLLTKPSQAITYDKGYFYPGPAVADVPLSMAPESSQQVIKDYGRPMYEKLIADVPVVLPLASQSLVYAFERWDQQVGARAGH
jgi:putative spermidine/putrescine transport system substrate-binding protein